MPKVEGIIEITFKSDQRISKRARTFFVLPNGKVFVYADTETLLCALSDGVEQLHMKEGFYVESSWYIQLLQEAKRDADAEAVKKLVKAALNGANL